MIIGNSFNLIGIIDLKNMSVNFVHLCFHVHSLESSFTFEKKGLNLRKYLHNGIELS